MKALPQMRPRREDSCSSLRETPKLSKILNGNFK